jgi:hypothetical protein
MGIYWFCSKFRPRLKKSVEASPGTVTSMRPKFLNRFSQSSESEKEFEDHHADALLLALLGKSQID